MPSVLKKAFQLVGDDLDIQKLDYLNAKLKVSSSLLFAAKAELTDTLIARNNVLNEILLNKYEYIIGPNDTVAYLDQTHKILIYDGKGPDTHTDYGKIST